MPRYEIDGIAYPSCTEILGMLDKSQALMYWAARLAGKYFEQHINDEKYKGNLSLLAKDAGYNFRDVSAEAMDIGSEVHSSIEAYIKWGKDKIGKTRPEVENALLAFWQWESDNKVKWIASEMPIVNKDVGYAGTLDAIAEVNGVITCIDFKSANDVYDEYYTQVIAYKYARESMSGDYEIKGPTGDYTLHYEPVKISECAILLLNKESGMPDYVPVDSQDKIKREWVAFQALVKYYYVAKRRRLKNNKFAEAGKNI